MNDGHDHRKLYYGYVFGTSAAEGIHRSLDFCLLQPSNLTTSLLTCSFSPHKIQTDGHFPTPARSPKT